MFDKRKNIRELRLINVLNAREIISKGKNIRNFAFDTLIFDAIYYTELINWNVAKLLSPRLFRKISNEETSFFIQSGDIPR